MECGVYRPDELSEKDYHALEYFSASLAKRLLRQSPKHAALPIKQTDSMRLGSLVHLLALEPWRIDEVCTLPDFNWRSKTGKADVVRWALDNGIKDMILGSKAEMMRIIESQRTIVTHEMMETAVKCVSALRAHPIASELIEGPGGQNELTVIADLFGLRAKCRIDRVIDTGLIELKSTFDASSDAFARAAEKFDYHLSAGFYRLLARGEGLPFDKFHIVAVETSAPFGVMVYELDDELLHWGEALAMEAFEIYRNLPEKRDDWPCYPEEIAQLELPKWARLPKGEYL